MEQLFLDIMRGSRDLGEPGLILLAVSFFVISLTFLPRPPACIVAGLVYGVSAFPVVLAALTAGAATGFIMARYLFQARFCQAAERRPKWQSVVDAIDSQGWMLVLLLRLASPVPGSATTYLMGLTGIGFWPYVGATCAGLAPQTLLFMLIGAVGPAALDGGPLSAVKLVFLVAGIVTSAAILWLVGRRSRALLSNRLAPAHPPLASVRVGDEDARTGQSWG